MKHIMIFPLCLLLLCPLGLAACGSKAPPIYTECNDSRAANADGWISRYDFAKAGLAGLKTQGLREQGNDYISLVQGGFELELFADDIAAPVGHSFSAPLAATVSVSSVEAFLAKLESCVKFANVTEPQFIGYCAYLFDDFSVNKDKNGTAAGNVSALISGFNNNPIGIKARIFQGYYDHDGSLEAITVYYFQQGYNQIVQEHDMYVGFPMEQIKPKLPSKPKIGGAEFKMTWPLYGANLAFGSNICNRNNVPTIYSTYYETKFDFMFFQIFVPDYTVRMEEFYEGLLNDYGYTRIDSHWVADAHWSEGTMSKSLFKNGDKVKIYRLAETRVSSWIILFVEQDGHLLIVPWVEYMSGIIYPTFHDVQTIPFFQFGFEHINQTYADPPMRTVFDHFWGDYFDAAPEFDFANTNPFIVRSGPYSDINVYMEYDPAVDTADLSAALLKYFDDFQSAYHLFGDYDQCYIVDRIEGLFAVVPTVIETADAVSGEIFYGFSVAGAGSFGVGTGMSVKEDQGRSIRCLFGVSLAPCVDQADYVFGKYYIVFCFKFF
ncbi:MAG: hypothetical protein FWE62_06260 [Firmicutes bacterium]|nr:hypothetical protein [Bacillota bacterium]